LGESVVPTQIFPRKFLALEQAFLVCVFGFLIFFFVFADSDEAGVFFWIESVFVLKQGKFGFMSR